MLTCRPNGVLSPGFSKGGRTGPGAHRNRRRKLAVGRRGDRRACRVAAAPDGARDGSVSHQRQDVFRGVRSEDDAVGSPRGEVRPDRHQPKLQQGELRRLQRANRRSSVLFVPHARDGSGRQENSDDRRRRRRTASASAAAHRAHARRRGLRVLHARLDRHRQRPARREQEPVGRRREGGTRGTYLPLRGVPVDHSDGRRRCRRHAWRAGAFRRTLFSRGMRGCRKSFKARVPSSAKPAATLAATLALERPP